MRHTPYVEGRSIDEVDSAWPEATPTIRSPFWYLIDHPDVTPADLLECVVALPEEYQAWFLDALPQPLPGLQLVCVDISTVFDICGRTPSPWMLGALMIAFKRGEMAGEVGICRAAGTAVVWVLGRLAELAEGRERALWNRVRRLTALQLLESLRTPLFAKLRKFLLSESIPLLLAQLHNYQEARPGDDLDRAAYELDLVFQEIKLRSMRLWGKTQQAASWEEILGPAP
ncbi:MAG: hypothetical protein KF796_04415 [Ramlibacter sp.]|nr:hypothetical protein [Ramlibacter sp.]